MWDYIIDHIENCHVLLFLLQNPNVYMVLIVDVSLDAPRMTVKKISQRIKVKSQ